MTDGPRLHIVRHTFLHDRFLGPWPLIAEARKVAAVLGPVLWIIICP